ncbi:MAG: hypothetical protein ACI9W6_000001, partial [Motiliproteus sp.]
AFYLNAARFFFFWYMKVMLCGTGVGPDGLCGGCRVLPVRLIAALW